MKHKNYFVVGILFCMFGAINLSQAQQTSNFKKLPKVAFQSPDTSMSIAFNARMQNRLEVSNASGDGLAPTQAQFLVRRFRLKSSGFLVDPRLTYKMELAFSKRDLGAQLGEWGNNLYDAYIDYKVTNNLGIRFGQFKLPGNRQRVISSGSLQLVDRSPVNGDYNLDRDIGLMLAYSKNIGPTQFRYKVALSNGEGRNTLSSKFQLEENEGNLAVTQRVEFLPFGAFTAKGDYFEADLVREKNPKLSIGAGYYYNNDAVRTQGQLGKQLYEARNINSFFADFIYKHQGLSILGEYLQMDSPNPVTVNPKAGPTINKGDLMAVMSGKGYNIQGGYMWPSFWEIAVRHSEVFPNDEVKAYKVAETNQIIQLQAPETETLIGVSKYIRGHNIKVQSDIGYIQSRGSDSEDFWRWRFQMELGF